MTKAPKKRAPRKVKPLFNPKGTVEGLLLTPHVSLDADEQGMVEQIGRQIIDLLASRVIAIKGPCSITQRKDGEYRMISMVGSEYIEAKGCLIGKRDGLIFEFKPISIPLGLKQADLETTMFEIPFRRFNSTIIDNATGMDVRAFLATKIDFTHNPTEAIAETKRLAEEAERERLCREATVKQESYGMNWGAF